MKMRIAASALTRMRGLLGRPPSWLGADGVLVLVPCASIHTFCMNRAIDVAFVNAKGEVVRSYEAVEPGHHLSCGEAVATLERFTPASLAAPILPGVPLSNSSWLKPGESIGIAPLERG